MICMNRESAMVETDDGSNLIGPVRDYGKGNEYHNTEASVKRQECDSILFTPKVASILHLSFGRMFFYIFPSFCVKNRMD